MTDHLDASPSFDDDPTLPPLLATWAERRRGAVRELAAQPAVDAADFVARLLERLAAERTAPVRGCGSQRAGAQPSMSFTTPSQ